jgi:hypothetical protein
MPTISYFYGIYIRMYVTEHPPPHFHAVYGDDVAFIAIESGEVIEGWLPNNAARLVKQWTNCTGPSWRRIGGALRTVCR